MTAALTYDPREDAKGHAFAEAISDAVMRHGPGDLQYVEKIEMAEAVTAFAVQWVKARNVASRNPQ
jgi:hypothetical protein